MRRALRKRRVFDFVPSYLKLLTRLQVRWFSHTLVGTRHRTRGTFLPSSVGVFLTLSLPGDIRYRNPKGDFKVPLELFWPSRELLLWPLLDHSNYKTWYEYEGKTFSQFSTAGTPCEGGQMIAKFFKVLKLCKICTQMMSNCLGKCNIGKK